VGAREDLFNADLLNRLTNLVHERASVGGSVSGTTTELSHFHYTVREDGKRTGLNENLLSAPDAVTGQPRTSTRGVSYGYDDAGRLTGELGQDGRGVSYRGDWGLDNVGNRTASTYQFATAGDPGTLSSSSTIGATFNQNDWLTDQSTSTNGGTPSTQSWSYDQNGAELTHGYGTSAPQQNGWGFDGRLLGTGTQGTATGGTGYTTDASGNRVSVTLKQGTPDQKTTKYLLDENTSYAQVLEERAPDQNLTDGNGPSVLQARYVWGGGLAPLAMWRKGTDGQWRMFYFLTDGQESVRQLSDGQGIVTDSYFYDAWGNQLAGGSGTTANPFRYTGQMLDASGKYFLRARYYDSATGRFLSQDPEMGGESDPITLHRYLYCGVDAVNFIDPSGRFTMAQLSFTMAAMGFVTNSVSAGYNITRSLRADNDQERMFYATQAGIDIAWAATSLLTGPGGMAGKGGQLALAGGSASSSAVRVAARQVGISVFAALQPARNLALQMAVQAGDGSSGELETSDTVPSTDGGGLYLQGSTTTPKFNVKTAPDGKVPALVTDEAGNVAPNGVSSFINKPTLMENLNVNKVWRLESGADLGSYGFKAVNDGGQPGVPTGHWTLQPAREMTEPDIQSALNQMQADGVLKNLGKP